MAGRTRSGRRTKADSSVGILSFDGTMGKIDAIELPAAVAADRVWFLLGFPTLPTPERASALLPKHTANTKPTESPEANHWERVIDSKMDGLMRNVVLIEVPQPSARRSYRYEVPVYKQGRKKQ